MMIVFVHVPKAAGTSLKKAIYERLEADNIIYDYNRPMAQAEWYRNSSCLMASFLTQKISEQVIFGHFLAGKYARFSGSQFIKRPGIRYAIFFRNPLQRAISHYFFWKRTHIGGHQVWERFTRENWSLERFLLGREHANFQSKFIWRFPIEQFDFIGLVDHYSDSLKMLGRAFPIFEGLEFGTENTNSEKSTDSVYAIDPELEDEFKRVHKIDYSLYSRSEEIFFAMRARYLRDGLNE